MLCYGQAAGNISEGVGKLIVVEAVTEAVNGYPVIGAIAAGFAQIGDEIYLPLRVQFANNFGQRLGQQIKQIVV